MAYVVFARKFRPSLFSEVIGQNHITRTLENAIEIGRIAQAYLFSGPRGIGKTSSARILAKALNCVNGPVRVPCNTCVNCVEIAEGRNLDVNEIDGASNRGIDEIRNLRENVRYLPAHSKYKIYIIDEVHMLTKEAFNALLKTLEEPPAHVVFIFATTEPHKLPATILSRCQRYDFRLIPAEEIRRQLAEISAAEGVAIDEESLFLIARRGDGSMRDSLSFLDQAVSFCGGEISREKLQQAFGLIEEDLYFRLTSVITSKSARDGILFAQEIISAGYDLREFFAGLIEHLRNLLVARMTGSADLIEGTESTKKQYMENAGIFAEEDILRLISLAHDAYYSMRQGNHPQINLELALVKMIKMESNVELSELIGMLDSALGGDVPPAAKSIPALSAAAKKAPAPGTGAPPGRSGTAPGKRMPAATENARAVPASAENMRRDGDGPDLALVREKWDTVLDTVRKRLDDLVPFLRKVDLTALNGNSIELVFPNTPENMKEYRRAMRNQVLIQDAINQAVNKSYVISIRPDTAAQEPGVPQQSGEESMQSAGGSHPFIGEIISLFDAEMVDPKRTAQTSTPREDSNE